MVIWTFWVEPQSFTEISSDLVPYCQERKPKKEPKIAPKFGHQGGERIEKDFFLDLSFAGRRPKHHNWRSWSDFRAAFNKLVLFVSARLFASGRHFNSLSIDVHQCLINLFKLFELFWGGANSPVLSVQVIPRKSATHFLWKVLKGPDGEVLVEILFARSSVQIQSFVPCEGDVVVVAGSIQPVSIDQQHLSWQAERVVV